MERGAAFEQLMYGASISHKRWRDMKCYEMAINKERTAILINNQESLPVTVEMFLTFWQYSEDYEQVGPRLCALDALKRCLKGSKIHRVGDAIDSYVEYEPGCLRRRTPVLNNYEPLDFFNDDSEYVEI